MPDDALPDDAPKARNYDHPRCMVGLRVVADSASRPTIMPIRRPMARNSDHPHEPVATGWSKFRVFMPDDALSDDAPKARNSDHPRLLGTECTARECTGKACTGKGCGGRESEGEPARRGNVGHRRLAA